MRTELPAERLQRRLHPPDEEVPAEDDDDPPDTTLSRWLPDNEPDPEAGWMATIRADPGRAGVIALAAVGVIAVLVTVFTLMRDTPTPVASANLPPVQMVSSASPTPSGAAGPSPDEPLVVSVVGLVHEPGLVTLSNGARIADALTAAGGALDGADLIGLNMARHVADGEQILVGIAAPPGEPPVMGSSISSGSSDSPGATSTSTATSTDTGTDSGGLVNLNTATVEELETLPGVGPVTAGAIVEWREDNGKFTSVEQLSDVSGIGPARLEKLRDRVHV